MLVMIAIKGSSGNSEELYEEDLEEEITMMFD